MADIVRTGLLDSTFLGWMAPTSITQYSRLEYCGYARLHADQDLWSHGLTGKDKRDCLRRQYFESDVWNGFIKGHDEMCGDALKTYSQSRMSEQWYGTYEPQLKPRSCVDSKEAVRNPALHVDRAGEPVIRHYRSASWWLSLSHSPVLLSLTRV